MDHRRMGVADTNEGYTDSRELKSAPVTNTPMFEHIVANLNDVFTDYESNVRRLESCIARFGSLPPQKEINEKSADFSDGLIGTLQNRIYSLQRKNGQMGELVKLLEGLI